MGHNFQLLFDFDHPTDAHHWRPVDDVIMGGYSNSQFQVISESVGVFSGIVSLENNGGFASIRSRPVRTDLRHYTGIEMRVRGDGKQYQFRLRDNPSFDGVAYAVRFTTDAARWQTLRFEFRAFAPTFRGRNVSNVPPLNTGMIHSFGFLIGKKQVGPFQLEIDWIQAYKEM